MIARSAIATNEAPSMLANGQANLRSRGVKHAHSPERDSGRDERCRIIMRASAWLLKDGRSSNLHSSVAKKLSAITLSWASPTEPIEGRTPASRHRLPNSIEVYCEP